MENVITSTQHWFSDPTVVKFMTAIIGIFIINLVVHFFRRSLSRFIPDSDIRSKLKVCLMIVLPPCSTSISPLGIPESLLVTIVGGITCGAFSCR